MRILPLLALLWTAPALADGPCEDLDGMPEGPVTAGVRPGDLGMAHRVCGRSETSLGGGAYLLADTANFYGHILATVELDGSYAVNDGTEVFAAMEIVRYDSVLAPLPDSYIGPGYIDLGASQRVFTSDEAAIAVNGKLVLPTGQYQNAYVLGIDLGVAGVYAPTRWMRLHAQLSGAFEANVAKGPANPGFGFAPTIGAVWRPGRVFALGLDIVASFGLTAPVDHLALAPVFRFSDGKRFGFELGLTAPLAGEERALAIADLRFSVKL